MTPSNVNLNSNIMRNADIDTSNKVRLLSVNTLNTHNLQTMHNLIHSSGLLTGCVCTVNGSAIDMTAGTLLFH